MPNGVPVGELGTSAYIRELPGGLDVAKALFDELTVGGSEYRPKEDSGSGSEITIVKLPGDAGFVTFRAESSDGSAAIDIRVPGVALKLHFP
jgi:hypothetical protein